MIRMGCQDETVGGKGRSVTDKCGIYGTNFSAYGFSWTSERYGVASP